ncbi:MAG: RNA chaperone Hfq [Sphingorhabdus sp.]|nr:RNA chaperone Hfq [Sphingorhabdus sp.]
MEQFDDLMASANNRKGVLQEVFLHAVRDTEEPVTMFLVNGVMLQGTIRAYDLFSLLLERENMCQLVYKHAVSTVQPLQPINLAEYNREDEEDD